MSRTRLLKIEIAYGIPIVLLGASMLVLRANLPRWVFGQSDPLAGSWALALFVCYALLGLLALACVLWIDRVLDRRGVTTLWKRIAIGAVLILKVLGIATPLVLPPLYMMVYGRKVQFLLAVWMMAGTLSVCAYTCMQLHLARQRQNKEAQRLQHESENLSTSLARAELAMLEAQIEPHFLFNTLAHVKRQYRKDPPAADHMLTALIEYLERALPALRQADWTAGDEIGLIEVYLNILAQRFGERLHFAIVMREADRHLHLPALTVATLVENALRHGLAPKADGGSVWITVERQADRLLVEVCDDGVGLRQSSGSGLGLATVRARLRSTFGEGAALQIEPRAPQGVRAALTIPVAA
jgi:sensor histidine kinase YesM